MWHTAGTAGRGGTLPCTPFPPKPNQTLGWQTWSGHPKLTSAPRGRSPTSAPHKPSSALGGRIYTILYPPRPFIPNLGMPGDIPQLLSAGPSVEPQDEEMPELPSFQAVEDASLQSPPRW